MGASAHEIERQITETRERIDANLTRLERRTRAGAIRYGRVAVLGLGVFIAAGIAIVVYRRSRRPGVVERLRDGTRGFSLRQRLPSVTIRFNEKVEESPGTAESIARAVAPIVAGRAGSVLLDRLTNPPDE